MKVMKYVCTLGIALCAIASASKAQTAFIGGGSSALALELGQAAIVYEAGVNGSCVWSKKTGNLVAGDTMNATDDRPGVGTTESGNVWVVWGRVPVGHARHPRLPTTSTCTRTWTPVLVTVASLW